MRPHYFIFRAAGHRAECFCSGFRTPYLNFRGGAEAALYFRLRSRCGGKGRGKGEGVSWARGTPTRTCNVIFAPPVPSLIRCSVSKGMRGQLSNNNQGKQQMSTSLSPPPISPALYSQPASAPVLPPRRFSAPSLSPPRLFVYFVGLRALLSIIVFLFFGPRRKVRKSANPRDVPLCRACSF